MPKRVKKKSCSSVTLKLPALIQVSDYHDFSSYEDTLQELIPGIKVDEVGYGDNSGCYVGVIYKGSSPSDAELTKMLDAEDLEVEGYTITEGDEVYIPLIDSAAALKKGLLKKYIVDNYPQDSKTVLYPDFQKETGRYRKVTKKTEKRIGYVDADRDLEVLCIDKLPTYDVDGVLCVYREEYEDLFG